jgi:glycosyltransferase involved in cell wall biosynthesis
MQRRKILLTGPIENFGGREIEVSTIARALEILEWDFKILSTGYIDSHSQVYQYVPDFLVSSINKTLIDKNFLIRISSFLSAVWNLDFKNSHKYSGNFPNKKFLNYYQNIKKIIASEIYDCDVIIFFGQLTSNYILQFIETSKDLGKPFVFRITGYAPSEMFSEDFKNVDAFLFHSLRNSNNSFKNLVLDQTLIDEKAYLAIPCLNKVVKNFIIIGTISEHKRVGKIIEFFLRSKYSEDTLTILGNGNLKFDLIEKYSSETSIKFLDSNHKDVFKYLAKSDCLIHGSISEAGPLVGLEAMAAGRLILSTKVGAMPSRLRNLSNKFWFEIDDFESFKFQYDRIKALEKDEIFTISNELKDRYLKESSNFEFNNQLKNVIEKLDNSF